MMNTDILKRQCYWGIWSLNGRKMSTQSNVGSLADTSSVLLRSGASIDYNTLHV